MNQNKSESCNDGFFLDGLSPQCGAALATAIAECFAEGLSANQLNVFAGFVTTIGDMMAYISAQLERNAELCTSSDGSDADKNC